MARRKRDTKLKAPFLKSIFLREDEFEQQRASGEYPFTLPWLKPGFELEFTEPVTIITGENGSGKSTLIEAIGALAGYDEAGGGKGYRSVDNTGARDRSGSALHEVMRAGWLPKVTEGWFFRAETFFSVARYLDAAGSNTADYLSASHGEGFLRVFEERMARQGFYLMDEPESALSPQRQLELFRLLTRIQASGQSQVVLATHSPILMAVPGADVLEITRLGFFAVNPLETAHFKLYRAFTADPEGFIADVLSDTGEE